MDILYNYQPFENQRIGEFRIDTNEYGPDGWITKIHEYTIIGETDDSYVYRLQESEHDGWVGDSTITRKYILPLGIHKSRFVRWLPSQLELF